MLTVDLRSVILMSGVLGVLLTLVFFFLRTAYPPTIRGLGWWAAAPALITLSTVLFSARGTLSDVWAIVLGNLVLLAGIGCFEIGAREFVGRPWVPVPRLAALAACACALYFFGIVEPNYPVRLALVGAVWASIFLAMARTLMRHASAGLASRLTVTVLFLNVVVLLLRVATASLADRHETIISPSSIQTLYVATNAIMFMGLGVGLILLAGERLRSEFEYLATHDALTQVMTRRVFLESCEVEMERCRRHGRSMALLLLDIDHFKEVNDVHGHQMGDRVLVDFTRRIQPLLRRMDLLARVGGEEFVVMLPDTEGVDAMAVAQRILAQVCEPDDRSLPHITTSIGVAVWQPEDRQVDDLLVRADRALYKAKAEGRNRIVEG